MCLRGVDGSESLQVGWEFSHELTLPGRENGGEIGRLDSLCVKGRRRDDPRFGGAPGIIVNKRIAPPTPPAPTTMGTIPRVFRLRLSADQVPGMGI